MAGAITIDAGGRRNSRPLAEPNVIPFIDVMLVLLIIFMVTAPTPTVDFRTDLPGIGPPDAGRNPTLVEVFDRGGLVVYAVDGQATTISELNDKILERALANNPALPHDEIFAKARIFIQPDQNLAYSAVIDAMQHLHTGGWAKVGVYAEEAETT
jgi:biopolymer transport protein ExbD